MNTIRFECPGCGQTIEAPEEAQFEQAKCPTCQNEFFPDKTRIVQPKPPNDNSSMPPIKTQTKTPTSKFECPYCHQLISPKAESCPSCGHPIRPDSNRDAIIVKIILIALAIFLVVLAIYKMEKGQAQADKAEQLLMQEK
jgi:uncharacterized paraquat-inducible protein A